MTSSKLYYYLCQLSDAELQEFKDFCAAPFFNHPPNLLRILEAMEVHVLADPANAPDRKSFFHLLYPDQTFHSGYFRKLLAELLQVFVEYTAHKQLKADAVQKRVYFLRELNTRREWKYFQSYYHQSLKENRRQFAETRELYRNDVLLNHEWVTQQSRSGARNFNVSTIRYSDSLDQFFMMSKFYLAGQWATKRLGYKLEHLEFPLIGEIEEHVANHKGPLPLGVRIYYHSWQVFRYPEDLSHYYALKQFFREQRHELDKDGAFGLATLVLNYCAIRINKGIEVQFFESELLDHYELMLESGMMLVNGKLDERYLKTIVRLGAGLGEFDRVEQIMEKYQPMLARNPHGIAVDYNRAILHFFRGQFEASRRLLNRIMGFPREMDSLLYGLDTRGYLCRIDYELGDLEALQYHGEAFNQFIRRNKALVQRKKESYLNFTRLLLRLANIVNGSPGKRKRNLEKYRKELKKFEDMPFTPWLIHKWEEAKKMKI